MLTLTISQAFDVPVTQLFQAWTNPTQLARWFAPGAMTVPTADADVKPGGRYRIVMQNEQGEQFIVGGEYLAVIENARLQFTWRWEGSEHTTQVAVAFESVTADRSALTLTHSEFTDQESCDKHYQGWQGCLANLEKQL